MSLNCNEINEILQELDLDGSFIQDVVQPGYDTMALYTYGSHGAKTVLVCTAQNACRLNETRRKIVKNDKPLRFMEILKSRIKGARIEKCVQIGFSRIVHFSLRRGEEKYNLYARLWSGAANLVLCDGENVILDSMFRRPKKGEVTGSLFALDDIDTPVKRVWPVRDFSELKEGFFSEKSGPVSYPRDFSDLSFNEKVDLWYGENAANLSRKALLEQAEKWYSQTRTRMEGALEKLQDKRREFSDAEKLKKQGDLVLSNAHLWDGASRFLECEDYTTGKTVRLLMDSSKSAQENAARYYDGYKKAVSGAEGLLHDIELAKKRIEKLEKQYGEMLAEENPVKLEQLLRRDTAPRQSQKKSHPGLDYTVDGWYILVGRDADENDELLRSHVRGSDMWLHVRDFSGGYVFIKNRPGKTVPLEVLLDAGNLALYHSKARSSGRADLYYTQVKYLRRVKNGPKGLVIPTHEKNLFINLDKKRLERLEDLRVEKSPV